MIRYATLLVELQPYQQGVLNDVVRKIIDTLLSQLSNPKAYTIRVSHHVHGAYAYKITITTN